MTELADALLEAQIAFAKRQLRDGDMFGDLVAEEIDHFLADAGQLTLGEVVTPVRIQDTAYKYAVQLPVEGAIPELVGEIAARLYRHRVNDEVAVAEVLDVREFDDLLVTIADLDVVQRVLQRILTDPVTEDIFVEVVVRAVDDAVTQGADGGGRTGVVGFLRGGLSRVVTPAMPVVERGVEQATRAGMHFVLGAAQGDVALVDAAREVWRRNATESVGTFRELVTADDVEDGVVAVFEFWKSFRDTAYFRALLDEGIAHVFDKYGETSLADLLAELGIGRDDLIEEGLRFGPPVLDTLDERGLLDDVLRRRLAPFYSSEEFSAAVESVSGDDD
ncbi:hypothetical protein [Gordonia sp. NPDC003585]|uniref:hypothetical protein n=1 Tax=Gordonia sp. NPDC003585 TaxID=3154275 RepID=UPI0033A2DDE7